MLVSIYCYNILLPARGKVALLIGNQKYECEAIDNLASPENDIRELSEVLKRLNFKVFTLVNMRFRDMKEALEVFYAMLALPGVYALFYYAGHGFNYLNSTYLMPVDAALPLHCDHNIAADEIGVGMQRKMSRAIKVLDCCRIRYIEC